MGRGEFSPFDPKPKPAEPFHVTELAEQLAGPQGHLVRKQLGERLGELLMRIEARLRSGLARDEYRQAEVLKAALRAAIRFVEAYPVEAPKLI